jgi:lysyl-tRNA synthetase class 2
MLEFYTAYKDVNWMMDFCEEMLREVIKTVNGSWQFMYEATTLDFSKCERLTMKEAIWRYWPRRNRELTAPWSVYDLSVTTKGMFELSWLEDPYLVRYLAAMVDNPVTALLFLPNQPVSNLQGRQLEQVHLANEQPNRAEAITRKYIDKLNKEVPESEEIQTARLIVSLFEKVVESELKQPTFITDFPKIVSPLSKASPENSAVAERFELYVAGMEVANGFSELNDPVEQYERFEEQTRQREGGDEEAMQMDVDYVRALSYGMPPAAGIGIGIDRLTMLLTNRRSIRDVILFPHMRPQRPRPEEEEPAGEGAAEEQ